MPTAQAAAAAAPRDGPGPTIALTGPCPSIAQAIPTSTVVLQQSDSALPTSRAAAAPAPSKAVPRAPRAEEAEMATLTRCPPHLPCLRSSPLAL